MDEYLVPTEAWQTVNARNQGKFNVYLAVGTIVLAGTILFARASELIYFGPDIPRLIREMEMEKKK